LNYSIIQTLNETKQATQINESLS